MRQGGNRPRLPIEAPLGLRVTHTPGGQDLDSDVAIEPRVLRAVNLTHPSSADGGDDLVGTKASPGSERHLSGVSIRRSSSTQNRVSRDGRIASVSEDGSRDPA